MGNTGFDQMAVTIEFMFYLQIDPMLTREMELVKREEVTIVHLGATQQRDKGIHKRGKCRVWVKGVDARGGIEPFVSIRVRKEKALAKAILFSSDNPKIIDAARCLQLSPLMEDCVVGVDLQAWRPKGIGDDYIASGKFLHTSLSMK
jgi:hypothetical protein